MRRGRPGRPARRLRVSIEAMPPATKRAMLEGVRSGAIIAGAYPSPRGHLSDAGVRIAAAVARASDS